MEDPDTDPSLYLLQTISGIFTGNFTPGVFIGLAVILLLLFCSAAISGSEIAFFSLSPSQLNDIRSGATKKGRLILSLLEKPKRLLATILIANNFVNVAIIIISSYIISRLFDFSVSPVLGFIVQVLVVTAMILMFGEIMPKIVATQNPIQVASAMAAPMIVIRSLFRPLSALLVKSTNLIDKRIERKGHEITIDDLSEALDLTSGDNETPDEDKKILKGIVKFGDIAVKEIMRSRVDVTAVDDKTPFGQLLTTILDSGYSRMPVFRESFDKVTGILYIKDLLPHLSQDAGFEWQKLQRPAFFVPENKRISDLLHEFQSRKIHMAIVVDEYGGTSGLVTLEDVLEEIVGEINDEFDSDTDDIHYSRIDENTYLFEGKTLLNDFCKLLGIEDKVFAEAKGESDTLAGLMLELAGKIPGVNEPYPFDRFIFQADTVDKRRIKKVKVRIVEPVQGNKTKD